MYNNINDYEILYMIGENINFDTLYKKYQPLIYKVVKNYQVLFKNYGYEIDDLMQIGYLTLYKSSYLYNYNDSLFYTYFLASLKKALINEIRKNESNKRKCLNESFSYDSLVPNTNMSYIELIPSKKKENNDENEKRFIIFKNSLSFVSSCVFEMLYNGFSHEEIMKFIDEDKNSIIKSIKEIRKQKKAQNY